jgi:FkbM family methyltransferase
LTRAASDDEVALASQLTALKRCHAGIFEGAYSTRVGLSCVPGQRLLDRARGVFIRANERERIRQGKLRGYTIYYPSRSLLGRYIEDRRGWDAVLEPIVRLLVDDERPLIVDVGANIGASLIQMKAARPEGRFVCFEPSARFRSLLARTVVANGWRDVIIEPVMLGRNDATRKLFTNVTTASAVAQDYDGHVFLSSSDVVVRTLDGYLSETGPLSFLKIDTDGLDFDVLLGCRAILERDQPLLFFEFEPSLLERAGHQPSDVLSYLDDLGYRCFGVFSNFGDALEVTQSQARVLELARSELYLDLLCVHSSSSHAIAELGGAGRDDRGEPLDSSPLARDDQGTCVRMASNQASHSTWSK